MNEAERQLLLHLAGIVSEGHHVAHKTGLDFAKLDVEFGKSGDGYRKHAMEEKKKALQIDKMIEAVKRGDRKKIYLGGDQCNTDASTAGPS